MMERRWIPAAAVLGPVFVGALVVLAAAPRPTATVDRSRIADGRVEANVYPSAEPGETTPMPRRYPGDPPHVPHAVAGFVVSRDANDCLDCHLEGGEVEPGHTATRVPASHFVDPFTGERSGDTVAGMRYQCLQCHVPQAVDAAR